MFEQNVYPIINAPGQASDCSGCHSAAGPDGNTAGFVATSLADAYTTITGYPHVVGDYTATNAGLLVRMASTDVHVTSRGRVFSDAQKQAITAWLAEEVSERSGGGGGSGSGSGSGGETTAQATSRVLNQWSACMTLANFTTANMASAWGNYQTDNGSTCTGCHSTGGQGFIATTLATSNGGTPGLFTTLDTNVNYLTTYFSVDLTGGPAAAKVIVNANLFKTLSTGTSPAFPGHPTFQWDPSTAKTALESFYNLTVQGLGTCQASGTKLNPPA